jgi:hypothetical protein
MLTAKNLLLFSGIMDQKAKTSNNSHYLILNILFKELPTLPIASRPASVSSKECSDC